MSQSRRSWYLCEAYKCLLWCQHFCWCSSFLSSHRKWSLMPSFNTVEVIILSTNCPKGLRTRWSGILGAMVPLLWSTLFLMLIRLFFAVTKYWQDHVRRSLYLHSWFQHIMEGSWNEKCYLQYGGRRKQWAIIGSDQNKMQLPITRP